MNDIIPDWIEKRPYLWPLYGYFCLGFIVLQMLDIVAPELMDQQSAQNTAVALYFVGHFPAAAWSYWLFKKARDAERDDQARRPWERKSD
jgi:hypothetical protein